MCNNDNQGSRGHQFVGGIWKKTEEGESNVIIFINNDINIECFKNKKILLKRLKKTHMTEEEN